MAFTTMKYKKIYIIHLLVVVMFAGIIISGIVFYRKSLQFEKKSKEHAAIAANHAVNVQATELQRKRMRRLYGKSDDSAFDKQIAEFKAMQLEEERLSLYYKKASQRPWLY